MPKLVRAKNVFFDFPSSLVPETKLAMHQKALSWNEFLPLFDEIVEIPSSKMLVGSPTHSKCLTGQQEPPAFKRRRIISSTPLDTGIFANMLATRKRYPVFASYISLCKLVLRAKVDWIFDL